jgi:thiol-disulfide isomerase/thioredoxin
MKTLIIVLLFAAYNFANQKDSIEIQLFNQEGFGVFKGGTGIVFPSKDKLHYEGIPPDVKEYVVRNVLLKLPVESSKPDERIVQQDILILIGTDNSDKRVIIVDTNNDRDFSDEIIHRYEYPLDLKEELAIIHANFQDLPHSEVTRIFVMDGNFIEKTFTIKPIPYQGSLIVHMDTDDETEKKYFLSITFPQHKKGIFKFNNLDYEVYVTDFFNDLTYSQNNTRIFIAPADKAISEKEGDIPLSINDIINLDGYDFLIDRISLWGDVLTLKFLGENTNPAGFTEGYWVPEFHALTLENDPFRLDQYPNDYILLDFWGTWCAPCISQIPELKKLYSQFKYSNFQMVGVALDRNPDMVKNFVKMNQMDWVHIFVDFNRKDKNTLVDVLKISKYPTTILINPAGQIIAREKSIEEIRTILKSKLYEK